MDSTGKQSRVSRTLSLYAYASHILFSYKDRPLSYTMDNRLATATRNTTLLPPPIPAL